MKMNKLLPEMRALHRGDTPEQITIDLHIPLSLAYFSGHFPGLPLLPGVVQIDWAVRFAREHLGVTSEFTLLENIKFLAPLQPDANVNLTLVWDKEKNRIEFTYASAQKKHSSGRIQLGGNP